MNLAGLLAPRPCPFELIRIGGSGDGAYLVPDDLVGIDACFSPGVNNSKDFEDALVRQFGIKCHMCDFSSDPSRFKTPLIEGMQTFTKKWLDTNGSSDSISLAEWIGENSPFSSKDLILQMDIEGAEYRNLLSADQSTLSRFRIVVIELHGLLALEKSLELSKDIETLLRKLSLTHVCVHVHPNNYSGAFIDPDTGLNIPYTLEATYLRRDRFCDSSSKYIRPQLPHPDDICWNVRKNPPLHLNEKWLASGKRSPASEMKVLQDNLDFYQWEVAQLKRLASCESQDLNKVFTSSVANLLGVVEPELRLPDANITERALGKKYFLSESYPSYPSEGIVGHDSRFFFHTALDKNQSITIDLVESCELFWLVIGNRADACHDRAQWLFYVVHEGREFTGSDSLPVMIPDGFHKPGGPESITPLFGRRGRYITVFSPVFTALHFSFVKVF